MKRFVAMIITVLLLVTLVACSNNEITLDLAYGERTGTYTGETNDTGLPHGQGKFTSKNENGEKWTYEGEFKNGHFDGEGKTTWDSGIEEIGTYKDDVIVPLTGRDVKAIYSSPQDYKNHVVEMAGVVFTAPEYVDGGVAVQMFSDINNHDNNTIVYILDDEFEVDEGEYLHIIGKIGDAFEGTNMMGGTVVAPTVYADEYEIIDYKDAVSPTLKEVTIEQTQEQSGYSICIQKVEFAENETRLYMKVDNQGSDTFYVYSFNGKIIQNGKQYEEQSNWEADYPEVQSELLPGTSSEGIIVFPAIDEENFTFVIDAHSDNWREEIELFSFDISVQ